MNKKSMLYAISNPKHLLALSALVTYAAPLSARTYDWNVSGPGSYNVMSNWLDGGSVNTTRVPGSSDVFHVDNGGTLLITDADSAGDIIRVQMGTLSGESGYIEMEGGTLITRDDLQVGKSGSGTFTLSGGELNTGKLLYLAQEVGGAGTFVQSGGAIEATGGVVIGHRSTGIYTMSGGTLDTLGSNIIIGNRTTGSETAHGTLNHSAGQIDAEFFVVGDGVAGTDDSESGLYNVSGTAVLNAAELLVGRSGAKGRVEMTGGTVNIDRFFAIAHGSGAVANFNQSGGTLNKVSGISYISRYVTGDANTASWTLSNSAVANLDDVLVAQGIASGTLTLNGGTLSANQIRSEATGGGTSILNLNGGTIVARSTNANFLEGLTQARVQSGGVTFDSDDHDIAIAQDLVDDAAGSVIKAGLGTLTFTGNNTYLGDTVVNAGSLVLADGGSMTFAIGEDGSNNQITGTGNLDLSGLFIFDFENVASSAQNMWTIVDASLSAIYGESFSILNFTESEAGVWTYQASNLTYEFREATGVLSAVPESAQFAFLMGILVVSASVMRRKPREMV
ncbi:autotransporter-associated beta strand repeat-containing protein [Coraliomargarita sp. SDUM461004]|uniref:Autotransporter-associated beta strand repeat-containing protein n=1 Tax=Thalassobacterium sedimentorum TaxID=3041258 RepID=A0ABU1AG82_9BACT|nr:autotransporter-associated beta strand repeat-containing protein [Coraliomargarita sp. SDUM461004]MDQ8193687.1 autotransporter-associated beta strand repeat-containing protein [Coraliomargarita sp. SDUM461004]